MKRFLKKLIRALLCFWVFLFFFIPKVHGATLDGWANNIDIFTDVNLGSCGGSSCSSWYTLTPHYFYYDNNGPVQYAYFTSNSHNLGTYGDMILNFHRYKSGYLYSHSSYVCFSSNVTINNVELYTGSYNDTINKVGNLIYNNILIQTLDNQPFDPATSFYKCQLFVDLFVPKYDGQNMGTVIYTNNSSTSTQVSLIGEKYESLGLYSQTIEDNLSDVISSSGLATASSVNQVNTSINQVKQEITELNNAQEETNNTLKDSSVDSSDDTLSNLQENLPTNSVISDILLLPVRLLQAIINSLGGTCSSFNLGSLYGTNLVMPCIDIEHYVGTAIWTFIDLVFSGMFVLAIRKKFIQIWENITNLKGGGNEVD